MRNNKRVIVWVPILLGIMLLMGCKKQQEIKVTVNDLVTSIEEQISKDKGLNNKEELKWDRIDLTGEQGKEYMEKMKLDNNSIEEAICLKNSDPSKGDLIIIAKAKEEKDIKSIVTAFKEMKEVQDKEWKDKGKDEYKKVQGTVIQAKDKYVVYLTYDDTATIKTLVDDQLLAEQ